MGNVNCCEIPKDTQKEEIETHLTGHVDHSRAGLKTSVSENKEYKEIPKPKVVYDKKTEKIMKIQSIVKRFLTKGKFSKRIELQQIALKEFFRTHGVLCNVDDIDYYVNPKVLQVEKNLKNRKGIYSNPNIPNNILQDISYQPFYSIDMPCTYLVESKDDPNNRSGWADKDNAYSTTNNVSDNEQYKEKRPVYKGHWSIDRKKNGYGIMVNTDGSKYEGLFRKGMLDGKGRYITVNGDFFEGNFIKGAANGYGIFIHSDGSLYKGQWMNDLPWGEGEEWLCDGSYYKGDFFQGKKFGIGEFKWADGSVYIGGVKNDLLNGEGIYTWMDGRKYKGFWQENTMNGNGCLEYPDGSKYEGQFLNNKRHGQGVYYYSKKKYYEGPWVNGKQHGRGKLVKNGEEEIGEWIEGKKVKT